MLPPLSVSSDADATVEVWKQINAHQYGSVAMPRFQFITWGREKAVSRYAYCKHMVALGVLRRNPLELAAQITGQREDLNTHLAADRNFVRHVQASEQFYHLQQFIGRGRSREVSNGQAKAATVRVYDQADFSLFIEQGLPGTSWTAERPARKTPAKRQSRSNTKRSTLADKIVRHVRTLKPEKTSVTSLKDSMGYTGCRKAFGRSLATALKALPWTRDGRSISPT